MLVIIGLLPKGTVPVVLIALAAAAGPATPPLDACVRTLLPAIAVDAGTLPALFAFESTVLELTFGVGPPLALGLGVLWSTGAALAVGGLVMLAAMLGVRPAACRAAGGRPAAPTGRAEVRCGRPRCGPWS